MKEYKIHLISYNVSIESGLNLFVKVNVKISAKKVFKHKTIVSKTTLLENILMVTVHVSYHVLWL